MDVMLATASGHRLLPREASLTTGRDGVVAERFLRLANGELDRAYRLGGLILGNRQEAVDVAADTDSTEVGTAWIARALALSILGRGPESSDAAKRARAIYEAKGSVNALRRAEALITE